MLVIIFLDFAGAFPGDHAHLQIPVRRTGLVPANLADSHTGWRGTALT